MFDALQARHSDLRSSVQRAETSSCICRTE